MSIAHSCTSLSLDNMLLPLQLAAVAGLLLPFCSGAAIAQAVKESPKLLICSDSTTANYAAGKPLQGCGNPVVQLLSR